MYHISIENNPDKREADIIEQGIIRFNVANCGMTWQPLAVFLRDDEGKIVGGITGHTEWGWLHCGMFWLPDELRGQGWGSRLLQVAEDEAKKRGCKHAHLDTFGFQARGFYEKHGYRVFGVLEDYPGDYHRYYMRKDL